MNNNNVQSQPNQYVVFGSQECGDKGIELKGNSSFTMEETSTMDVKNPTIKNVNGKERSTRKRSRASKRAPTTVFNTDPTNFRAMVQRFTGLPMLPHAYSHANSSNYAHGQRYMLARPLPRRVMMNPYPHNNLQKANNSGFIDMNSSAALPPMNCDENYNNFASSSEMFYNNNNVYTSNTAASSSTEGSPLHGKHIHHANMAPTVWDELFSGLNPSPSTTTTPLPLSIADMC